MLVVSYLSYSRCFQDAKVYISSRGISCYARVGVQQSATELTIWRGCRRCVWPTQGVSYLAQWFAPPVAASFQHPQGNQRLQTPGLFINSVQACLATSAAQELSSNISRQQLLRSPVQLQQLLAATAPVRWALDTGVNFPRHVTAHQAAAALLLMLQQLPDSFMPPVVSANLMRYVPAPSSCMSLLSDAMSVAEWATARHLISFFKAALLPETAVVNGLNAEALAAALADVMFGGQTAGELLTFFVVVASSCHNIAAYADAVTAM